METSPPLDPVDRKILAVLQEDGKISLQDLAERVGLSASPCWRRVRKLEETGVIRRYVALLDRKALGFGTMAFVQVSLTEHSEAMIQRFDSFVATRPEIIECCTITGNNDYLLRVIARDAEDLERFLMKDLLALGIVRASSTNFVLRQRKFTTAVPTG